MTKTTSDTTSDSDNKTEVIVKKKHNLRVVIYYARKDDNFPKAGKFRLARLKKAFPADKGNETRIFTAITVADFISVWGEIKTLSEQYLLKRIHIFGHGSQHNIYFKGGSLGLVAIRSLPVLEWSPDGVIVVHTCQSGRLLSEAITNEKGEIVGQNNTCVAKELSALQDIRVIGTSVKAGFSKTKDHRDPWWDSAYFADDIYLWCYKSGATVKEVHGKDSEYDLVEDYKIWACFQYAKGKGLARDLNDITTDLYFI